MYQYYIHIIVYRVKISKLINFISLPTVVSLLQEVRLSIQLISLYLLISSFQESDLLFAGKLTASLV